MAENNPFVILPIFFLFFFTVCFLISKAGFSKYKQLVRVFPLGSGRGLPERWIFISPYFGGMEGSRNGFQFSADREGFYLQVFWLFRFGLPRVFVPWGKVTVRAGKSFKFFPAVIFSFEGLPDVKMTWQRREWEHAKEKFSEIWPGHLFP